MTATTSGATHVNESSDLETYQFNSIQLIHQAFVTDQTSQLERTIPFLIHLSISFLFPTSFGPIVLSILLASSHFQQLDNQAC